MAWFTAKDRANWQRLDLPMGMGQELRGKSRLANKVLEGICRGVWQQMTKAVTLLAWVSRVGIGRWVTSLEAERCWYRNI